MGTALPLPILPLAFTSLTIIKEKGCVIRMLRLFTVPVVLYLLVACSTVLMSPDMDRVKDQPLAHQEGYEAGCHSGFVAGGSTVHSFKMDTARLREDEEYDDGWNQGYRECKSDFREMCKSKALVSKADLYCADVRQQGLDKEE